MSFRHNDLLFDRPELRSIWDEGRSNVLDKFDLKQLSLRDESESMKLGNRQFGSMYGGYDCNPKPRTHDILSPNFDSPPRSKTPIFSRRSTFPFFDQTPGYATMQNGYSDADMSPTSTSSGSSFGYNPKPRDVRSKSRVEEALLKLLTAPDHSYELKELLRSGTEQRRATVCNGILSQEREKLLYAGQSRSSFPNENSLSSPFGSSITSGYGGQTSYELALEEIEKEAKMRRTCAFNTSTAFTWKGTLKTRHHPKPTYATKVFVGGLPYDVTPEALSELFGKFGLISVQFPPRGRGHAYLVFESEQQVQDLLDSCENKEFGKFFHWVASRRGKDRLAQIIPWVTEDSDWLACESEALSPAPSIVSDTSDFQETYSTSSFTSKFESSSRSSRDSSNGISKQNTVFVGALHGEITAEGLQKILSELFGPVVHIGIDTDRCHYPSGSARATFKHRESFHKAVLAEFVHVVTPRFSKTIQLDAYIEDGACSICKLSTPIFCRHPTCFCYYCPSCFEEHRNSSNKLHADYHPPVMRNRNNNYGGNGATANYSTQRSKDRSQTF